jgi:hypothetical protein
MLNVIYVSLDLPFPSKQAKKKAENNRKYQILKRRKAQDESNVRKSTATKQCLI